MKPASLRELQLIEASRRLAGSRVVVIGSGAAFAVASMADHTCAAGANFVIDSGVVGASLPQAIVSVTDPALTGALRMGSMTGVFQDLLQAGRVDTSVLSAAQIDSHGNLNSSYLGGAQSPSKRFPGSGGASAMAAFSRHLLVVVKHELRRFVPRVDYVTCAGPRRSSRRLERITVVTDKAVLSATRRRPRLALEAILPGVQAEEVQALTGFPLHEVGPPTSRPAVPSEEALGAPTVRPATDAELQLLREVVDPLALYRG